MRIRQLIYAVPTELFEMCVFFQRIEIRCYNLIIPSGILTTVFAPECYFFDSDCGVSCVISPYVEMTNYVRKNSRNLIKKMPSRLAPIETISFCGGVHHKRYSVEREKWS